VNRALGRAAAGTTGATAQNPRIGGGAKRLRKLDAVAGDGGGAGRRGREQRALAGQKDVRR
jgi:hypothetical protein